MLWLQEVGFWQDSLLGVPLWVFPGVLAGKPHHVPAHAFVQASLHLRQVRSGLTVEEGGQLQGAQPSLTNAERTDTERTNKADEGN